MQETTLFTDGACKGNPGPGGWGFILSYDNQTIEKCGGESNTTNNRMELMAIIQGLQHLPASSTVHIYTDSVYACKGMTEWIAGWQKKSWRTSAGKPVKNIDLWQLLLKNTHLHQVHWHWVKGHAGVEGNERADALANQGIPPVS